MEVYVLFSENVGCPGNVITEDNELYFELDTEDEATNENELPYAHKYEKRETDYGMYEYHYLNTTNAQ